MMQMRSILRTASCSVKCCAYYRLFYLFPYLRNSSALPPVVCPLQRIYFIRYSLLCVSARAGAHGAWKNPSSQYRERMEYLHISLDAQAVGTMVWPQYGTQRVVNFHRQYSKSLHWSARKASALPAAVGLSF